MFRSRFQRCKSASQEGNTCQRDTAVRLGSTVNKGHAEADMVVSGEKPKAERVKSVYLFQSEELLTPAITSYAAN